MSKDVTPEDGLRAEHTDQGLPSSDCGESTQPKGFMNLPYELRLKVYSEFEFPDVIEHDGAGDMSVRPTRKALMTVCREVYLEWSPIFYRSARNLVLHRIQPSRKAYDGAKPTNLTTEDLEELLAKCGNDHRQSNITALVYHASMRHRLSRCELPVPDELVIEEMRNLGQCFKYHYKPFNSLLHIDLWETSEKPYLSDPFSRRHGKPWPLFSDPRSSRQRQRRLN